MSSFMILLLSACMFISFADVSVPGDHSMTAAQIQQILTKINAYRAGLVAKTVKLTPGKYPIALKPLVWDYDLYEKIKYNMANQCYYYSEGATSTKIWWKSWSPFTKMQDYNLYDKFLASYFTDAKIAVMDPTKYTGALHEQFASHYTYAFACGSGYCQEDSGYKWAMFSCTIRSDLEAAPIFLTAPYSPTNQVIPPGSDWTLFDGASYTAAENTKDAPNVVPVTPMIASSTSQAAKYLKQYAAIRLPAAEKKIAVDYHNFARKQFRLGKLPRNDGTFWPAATQALPNLNWSEYAEALALNWAYGRTFDDGHNPARQIDGYDHGENICDPGLQGGSCASALKLCTALFYLEGMCASSIPISNRDSYTGKNLNTACVDHVGHFTQVVWAETKYIGCACVPDFLVCNYYPFGNWVGKPMYK